MAEAEGVVEEGFSRGPTFSVYFVEKTRVIPPSTVRSPFRRRKSSKPKRTKTQTSIQGQNNTAQSTIRSLTSIRLPSDIELRMQHQHLRYHNTIQAFQLYLRASSNALSSHQSIHQLPSSSNKSIHQLPSSSNHFRRSRKSQSKAAARSQSQSNNS